MSRSSSRVIGVALAAALMAAGSTAMAQMYATGTTTGNPNTNLELLNRHNAPTTPPPVADKAPANGAPGYGEGVGYTSGTYQAPDGSMTNSAVSTGNYAKGGTSNGTGQTQMPADPPTGTLGSGAGGN